MDWFFPTLGFGVASALLPFLPFLNAEAYLAVLTTHQVVPLWPLAIAAALGQMVGKVVYFLIGRSSLDWHWVVRHTESPRFQASLARWQHRIGGRPLVAGALVLVSATVGLPPFAIIAVLAGTLRTSLWVFVGVGFVGRTLRFASILGAADLIFR